MKERDRIQKWMKSDKRYTMKVKMGTNNHRKNEIILKNIMIVVFGLHVVCFLI